MAAPPRPAALVFDLDGTLIDSRRDIATAVNRTRADFALPPLGLDEIVAMVGEGARLLVRRALGDAVPEAGLDGSEGAVARYLEHYGEVCLDTTRAYDGVEAMLAALAPRFPMALLSNKGEALSRRILAGLSLDRYFPEILGGDSLPSRKPDPAGLHLLAARLGVPVEGLLLIGDSHVDADTATAARSLFALALWGFGRPPASEGPAPNWRLANAGELTAALDGLA